MENCQIPYIYSSWDEEKQKNTQYIMNFISRFSVDNSFAIKLDKQARSLPLSDQIHHSDKRFVLIQNFCMVRLRRISLVAYRAACEVPTHSIYCCNMSTLKNHSCRMLFEDELAYMKKDHRFYGIYEQILKILPIELISGAIFPFEYPFHIKGQISYDRSGFGFDSNGINKTYGQTSPHLYVIGMRVE